MVKTKNEEHLNNFVTPHILSLHIDHFYVNSHKTLLHFVLLKMLHLPIIE